MWTGWCGLEGQNNKIREFYRLEISPGDNTNSVQSKIKDKSPFDVRQGKLFFAEKLAHKIEWALAVEIIGDKSWWCWRSHDFAEAAADVLKVAARALSPSQFSSSL